MAGQFIQPSINPLDFQNAAGIICPVCVIAGIADPVWQQKHLLFINLITDSLPAIALGLEPHRANVMEESRARQILHYQQALCQRNFGGRVTDSYLYDDGVSI